MPGNPRQTGKLGGKQILRGFGMPTRQESEPRVAAAVSRWVVRWRTPLALLGLLLGLFGVERSRQLEYSRSIASMFDR
ncbi:MAG: hypothetical protein EBS83_13145, partial [Planctomycetia bacterium]|nr:hypothetical protein [Planctomycetia bacterium]